MIANDLASQLETAYGMITQFQNDEGFAKEYITRYVIFLSEESKYIPQTLLEGFRTKEFTFRDIWLLTSIYYQFSVNEKDPCFLTKELKKEKAFKEGIQKINLDYEKSKKISFPQMKKSSPIPSFSMSSKELILGNLGKIHTSITFMLRNRKEAPNKNTTLIKFNINTGETILPSGKVVAFDIKEKEYFILKALCADKGRSPVDVKMVLSSRSSEFDYIDIKQLPSTTSEIAKKLRRRLNVEINNKKGKLSLRNVRLEKI